MAEFDRDEARARQLVEDAAAALARLASERTGLAGEATDGRDEAEAAQRLTQAEAAMAEADRALQQAQERLAEANVTRQAAERARQEANQRVERLGRQISQTGQQQADAASSLAALPDIAALKQRAEQAGKTLAEAESEAQARELTARSAREAEAKLRPAVQEADRQVQQLETEARTIRKMVDIGTGGRWPRAVDGVSVAKGYETALGAALGEDLDAATDPAAPAHWALLSAATPDPALPKGAVALSDHVTAPPALARRLAQIGLVPRADGARLSRLLLPGQRLVSPEGDLWRWDGFVAAANAPTPAARRLAEKNRLGEIEARARESATQREGLRREVEAALNAVREATTRDSAGREGVREARRAFDSARDLVLVSDRRRSEAEARLANIAEALARLTREKAEADSSAASADAALAGIKAPAALVDEVAQLKIIATGQRAVAAEARAALQGFVREREMRNRRLAAIDEDTAAWRARQAAAESQSGEVEARRAAIRAERSALDGLPAELIARRRTLDGEMEAAEQARKGAADRRAEGETALALGERAAREALAALSAAEVARARSEAHQDAAADKRAALARTIEDETGLPPSGLAALTGLAASQPLPGVTANDIRLADLRRERERLGAVNLRAEAELAEVETSRQDLTREHDDLGEAIRRLRRGIDSLNAEGRQRLNAAFEVVNGHFGRLFSRLFGGGSAELQLIESDDPLEAGLEIVANPPGKKPQVLTLLSGGEQALTATALIFAVFLTNPSPVCVLDEVDAPLDDANVERLCDLLADMAQETATRFVVITHNPISMARMDRLFGVTMAERGVSQLVSVDLQAAERLAEAG
jgi:chromosome segregation protein